MCLVCSVNTYHQSDQLIGECTITVNFEVQVVTTIKYRSPLSYQFSQPVGNSTGNHVLN
jgi:hypothetical protein